MNFLIFLYLGRGHFSSSCQLYIFCISTKHNWMFNSICFHMHMNLHLYAFQLKYEMNSNTLDTMMTVSLVPVFDSFFLVKCLNWTTYHIHVDLKFILWHFNIYIICCYSSFGEYEYRKQLVFHFKKKFWKYLKKTQLLAMKLIKFSTKL